MRSNAATVFCYLLFVHVCVCFVISLIQWFIERGTDHCRDFGKLLAAQAKKLLMGHVAALTGAERGLLLRRVPSSQL